MGSWMSRVEEIAYMIQGRCDEAKTTWANPPGKQAKTVDATIDDKTFVIVSWMPPYKDTYGLSKLTLGDPVPETPQETIKGRVEAVTRVVELLTEKGNA